MFSHLFLDAELAKLSNCTKISIGLDGLKIPKIRGRSPP